MNLIMYICCWKKKINIVICEKITFQNGPFYFVSFFFVLPQKPNIFTPTYYIVRVLGAPGITFSKKVIKTLFFHSSKNPPNTHTDGHWYIYMKGSFSGNPVGEICESSGIMIMIAIFIMNVFTPKS